MLFNKEIEDLCDDGFEGSIDEHHIFTEVFFGNGGRTSTRCLVTGVINFECDNSKCTDVPPYINNENSAITSEEDSCNVKEDSKGNSGSACFSEGVALSMRIDDDASVKRMKLSVDEFANVKPCLGKVLNSTAPLKGAVSGVSQSGSHSLLPTVTCRLVESSAQGVTSSCYLLKRHVETDRGGDMRDRDASSSRLSSLNGSDKKEVIANNATALPVSQESYANKLLVANPIIIVANKYGTRKRWKETCFVKLSMNEMSLSRDSLNDPRSRLRYHINHLLRTAGWEIGRRRRSDKFRGLGEYVYKSPSGRPIREFHKAWDLCGQSLFDDTDSVVQETDSKHWTDLTQFWADLSSTIQEIEELLDHVESTTALVHRWCLLDPFATVVFVDKTVGPLTAGKEVKAKRGFVINSSAKRGAVLDLKNVDISSLPACESDSTCAESDSCLFEVPISSRNANIILGRSDTAIPNQECHTSSPSCDRDTSDHNEEMPLRVIKGSCTGSSEKADKLFKRKVTCKVESLLQGSVHDHSNRITLSECNDSDGTYVQLSTCVSDSEFCGPSLVEDNHLVNAKDMAIMQHQFSKAHKFKMNDTSFLADVILKKKAQKKSKKLSEMSPLYQNDSIGLSISYKDEENDMDSNIIHSDSKGVQECLLANLRNDKSRNKSAPSSSQRWNGKGQFKNRKLHRSSGSSENLVQLTNDSKHMKEPTSENSTDKDPLCVKSLALYSPDLMHDIESTKPETYDEIGQKRSMTCQLKDDDLLISAVIKSKSFSSTTKRSSLKRKSKFMRKQKSQNGSCRLLPRSLNKGGGKHFMDGKWSTFAARTVLSWLIHTGVVSLNEVLQFRNPKDDDVVKDGLITWDGILCRCCGEVFSVSEFKIHSGFRLNQSCLNIFLESGKPFTLCQLEAWSAEYKARKTAIRTVQADEMDQNDDSCGLCGDVGELICCDSCPSTFHQACLYTQELPEGSWYCAHCSCWICGAVVHDTSAASPGALKCSQCEHKYHEACLNGKGINRGVASDTWFCGASCQEVNSGLQSRIGLKNLMSDGFSWSLLRCIHGDQKVHSAQRFVALKADCNSKLAVALTIMEECFLPMVDPRTGIDMVPHVLYNWGSQFARLNYHGFYTMVLEKDDVLMSVASIRIHGVTVAEMPLVATCSKHRRQGMCRRLMNSIEEMLKSFKVEKLVISAIPSLVDTWTVGFGFQPLEDNEKQSLNKINLMVFPGTIRLKKLLRENEAVVQHTGLCQPSPSGANSPGEAAIYSKGGSIIQPVQHNTSRVEEVDSEMEFDCKNLQVDEPVQQSENTSRGEEIDSEMEFRLADCKNLQVDEGQCGNIHRHFSGLSCKEPASLSVASQVEVLCLVESLDVYDEREISLSKETQETSVVQSTLKNKFFF